MSITKKVPKDLVDLRFDKATSVLFKEFSRTKLKAWILRGNILLNGEISSPREKVNLDDEIEVNPVNEVSTKWGAEKIDFEVLHETANFLVINKPIDLVIHPGAGISSGTLANGLLHRFPELKDLSRAGIVHRLDKDTSGLLIVARNEKFRLYFIDLLQTRMVKKNYKAFVVGTLRGNLEINSPIGRDKNNRTKMTCREDGKEAITNVRTIHSYGGYSLLDVEIETGRTHQIRVHFKYKDTSLLGDKQYGKKNVKFKKINNEFFIKLNKLSGQALHAKTLEFDHPISGERLKFDSELPNDIYSVIEKWRNYVKLK